MKKLLSLVLCVICVFSMSMTGYAYSEKEFDRDNPWVADIPEELIERGLTKTEMKSLMQLGFSLEEQMELTDAEITAYLGEKSTRAVRAYAQPPIRVENVPDDLYGTMTEYYTSGSGMVTGDFYADNAGGGKLDSIDSFTSRVFKEDCKKYYYLYGEWDSGLGYHKGIDMCLREGAPIYLPFSEVTVFQTSASYGAIFAQPPSGNVTYIFAHMKNYVGPGTYYRDLKAILGEQSNKSPVAIPSHLHFEVRSGKSDIMGNDKVQSMSGNLSPYMYMAGPRSADAQIGG